MKCWSHLGTKLGSKGGHGVLRFVCRKLRWFYWKYVGLMATLCSLPAWPWICYLYFENKVVGGRPADPFGHFMLDWGKQPRPGCHMQKVFYNLAMLFRPAFEFAMECICMDR